MKCTTCNRECHCDTGPCQEEYVINESTGIGRDVIKTKIVWECIECTCNSDEPT